MAELFGVRIASPREVFNTATAAAQSLGDGAARFGSSALARANELGRTIDTTVRDVGARVDRFIGDTQQAAQAGIRDGVNWTGQQIHRGAEAARAAVGDDTLLGRAASGVITGVEHRARFSVGVAGGVATEAVGLVGTAATLGSTAVQVQLSPTRREEVTTAIAGAVGSGLDTAFRYGQSVAADPGRLLGDAQAVGQGALDLGGRAINHYRTAIEEGRGPEAIGMTTGQVLANVVPVGAGANAVRLGATGALTLAAREGGEAIVREGAELSVRQGLEGSLRAADTPLAAGLAEGAPAVGRAGETGGAFTFRGDSRPASVIFNEGFAPRGTSTDLFAHALDNTRPPSAYVSTSQSFDVASGFNPNVYVVRPNNGIDVNRALGAQSPFPHELEIAVPGRIPPSDVRGLTLTNDGVSILNPNYVP